MKTALKLSVFLLVTFIVTSSIYAQSSASSNVTVNASLVKGITVNQIDASIDFAELVLTGSATSQTIDPDASTGANLEIVSHPNRGVTVSFSNVTLSNSTWATPLGATTGTMTFVPDIEHTSNESVYADGTPVTVSSGSSYTAANTSGSGYLYLWIGGSISISETQAPGDYTGTLTVNVAY